MKNSKIKLIKLCGIMMAAMVIMVGCSSTGMERSEKTSTTMETMDNDIMTVIAQIEITKASLEAMMRPNQQDIKSTYESFKENVSKMESKEDDFIEHAKEMKKRGKEYFAEWEKEGNEYSNPQIQQLSDQRRNELGSIYDRIAENSVGVTEAYRVYLSDIKEMQLYLSNDLTSKGIDTISPVSKKIVADGNNLKYNLESLQNAINRAREEMHQSGR
ncbi:MAG: DUF2959 family protein [Candidatus Kapaibacterium sp.]